MSDPYYSQTIRSRADGTDERVQVKIVDSQNPDTQQATVINNALNVNAIRANPPNSSQFISYNEVSNVAMGVSTQVISYTVPPGDTLFLDRVSFNGDNIADIRLNVNSVTQERKYSTFQELSVMFDYTSSTTTGFQLNAGDVLTIMVLHSRPYVGSFNARIQGTLIT